MHATTILHTHAHNAAAALGGAKPTDVKEAKESWLTYTLLMLYKYGITTCQTYEVAADRCQICPGKCLWSPTNKEPLRGKKAYFLVPSCG